MSASNLKFTPAHRRALLVLLARHQQGRSGRLSNTTDVDEGLLHWQSGAWLDDAGLAKMLDGTGWPSSTYLRITQAGLDEAAVLWPDGWADELVVLRTARRNGGR